AQTFAAALTSRSARPVVNSIRSRKRITVSLGQELIANYYALQAFFLTLSNEADLSFDEASEFWSEVCVRILNSLLRFKHPVYIEEQELRTISICDIAEPCFTRKQDLGDHPKPAIHNHLKT